MNEHKVAKSSIQKVRVVRLLCRSVLLHVSIGKSSHMITYCISSNVSWLFERFALGCKRELEFFQTNNTVCRHFNGLGWCRNLGQEWNEPCLNVVLIMSSTALSFNGYLTCQSVLVSYS